MAVTERPEDFLVEKPTGEYTHLTPFSPFESTADASPKSPLIILNTPLEKIDLRRLWANSSIQVCADGGANRLYKYFSLESEREKYVPSYITGDLDSLEDTVKEYYASRGATVIPQYCQYSSDFMKAIKVVLLHRAERGKEVLGGQIQEVNGLNDLVQKYVVESQSGHGAVTLNIAGGIGGRFDQTIQSINQMYALKDEFPWLHLIFFTSQDVIFMAPRGKTYVSYSDRTVFNTQDKAPKCGLLPFGKKTILGSKGLFYDVEDWPSEIGGNVSSSNAVSGVDGFIIESSENVVINVEVARAFHR